MKIFVSSLITGMEPQRAAVKRAILALGHEPLMAESFGAKATSPQIACLHGVRESDLVVIVLGGRYGTVQHSGVSATHEEFLEARGRKPILTFIQDGADPEAQQRALIDEAGRWENGFLRVPFATPEALGDAVTRAIHSWELAHAVAPVDPEGLRDRVLALLLPPVQRGMSGSGPALSLAFAPGPTQSILRPAGLEAPELVDALQREALFGTHRIFDKSLGVAAELRRGALVVHQEGRAGIQAAITLAENGDLLIRSPAGERSARMGFPALIEEEVKVRLGRDLAFGAWVLDRIDPTQRLTHVAIAVRLDGSDYYAWRTEQEQASSPNSGSLNMVGREDQRDEPVLLTPPHRVRAALTMDAMGIAEDLVVLLRRRWKSET